MADRSQSEYGVVILELVGNFSSKHRDASSFPFPDFASFVQSSLPPTASYEGRIRSFKPPLPHQRSLSTITSLYRPLFDDTSSQYSLRPSHISFDVSPDSDIASQVCTTTVVSVFFQNTTHYFLN